MKGCRVTVYDDEEQPSPCPSTVIPRTGLCIRHAADRTRLSVAA